MPYKASIIIPVYRTARKLDQLLSAIFRDESKDNRVEVIVIVDEPDNEVKSILKKYGDKIRVIENRERKGKVYALNYAVSLSTGDILIFLDNDVVPNGNGFINKVVEEMEGYDLGEIKKVIRGDGLVARMTYYDYVGFNFGNYLFSKFIGKCVGFNGAAFVMWRDSLKKLGGFKPSVAEDLDTGVRSYFHGLRFKFINSVSVMNEAPPSWREWFLQRKRWAIGGALWIKEYWRKLLKVARKNPKIVLVSILMLFPTLAVMMLSLLLSNNLFEKIILLTLLTASSTFSFLVPLVALTSYKFLYSFVKNLVVSIIAAIIFGLYFYNACKKLGLSFDIKSFLIYFFVYSPLWLMLLSAGFIRVFIFRKEDVEGWKI